MYTANDGDKKPSISAADLKKLDHDLIKQIDAALASVGDYGEVHLIVQHGEIRYINQVESHKARKEDDGKSSGG
jgi:hypothetical protein